MKCSSAPGAVAALTQWRWQWVLLAYAALIAASLGSLLVQGELSFGRNPYQNLVRTLDELSRPSFLDLWFGEPRLEYRSDDGRLLRVEDRRAVEASWLRGLLEATWTTLKIGTLGSFFAGVIALPLGFLAARNAGAPPWLASAVRALLDATRSIHTLVFGLIYVGIVGLGPMAGILAIASHSLGSYGKLYAEAIEQADANLFESGLALGLAPWQVIAHAMRRGFYPAFVSTHLYLWEFNVRDSTVLGLIGAGGLGLLVSEAVSLFQWERLATLLIVIVALVVAMDRLGAWVRGRLLRTAGR
ncbi:MAG: ABC transporter permease subunit [Methylibium sp.]|uniref:PhnE/PtxC family ABC transporter permease n=1 Tax=Methylibium sp. TaxID=2067992 RepID=UPI0018536FAD|nr:ABC transporter permease subunit [Methylibium sp.]MBA3597280.1 ABC transporter permease subunit [Methylibium sp.]